MKIVSYGPARAERPGVFVAGKGIAPLDPLLRSLGLTAIDTNTLLGLLDVLQPRIEEALGGTTIGWIDEAVTRLGPPVPFPEKVIIAGGNYPVGVPVSLRGNPLLADQRQVDDDAGRKNAPAPSEPILLLRPSNSVIGPYDALVRPAQTEQLDYEAEIGVVIGRGGRGIPAERAYEHIAGYLIANDVTAHDLAFKDVHISPMFAQPTRAKAIPTGAPLGPWLVTKDEIPDPHQLELQCWVNDELRQEGSSKEMRVDIPHLIENFSKNIELSPGDVIMTGTPTGSGIFQDPPAFLRGGDVVRMAITGLGVMRTPIADEP